MSKIDTSQRVFPDTKVVSPPDVFILFPPAMLHTDLNHFANQFGSVQSLVLKTTGKALVKYTHMESAHIAIGARQKVGTFGELKITSGNASKDKEINNEIKDKKVFDSIDTRKQACKEYVTLTESALKAAQLDMDTSSNAEATTNPGKKAPAPKPKGKQPPSKVPRV